MDLIEKNVDGKIYQFTMFGAKKSLKVLTRLTKIVGEPMARAIGALKGDGGKVSLDSAINGDALGEAVKALCEKMDEDTVLQLMEDLCGESACLCDGKKVIFDTHYAGKPGHLFKVLKAALEVQYSDFFDVFKGSLGSPVRATTQDQAT